ncbi:MAG: DUF3810 domain-containing protein [Sphingobacterium sp.]|uniref:DUF3810 domain-containing protein n=1 Tax=Sphingobacterium sp. JB170 TaxID=1434842 RepID=UPI00097EEDC7|nr:DUF3810 domain-containing protein [Sphingobacterium sp. JB170]SJN48318.1 hypothetical protein FM107_16965 [Sphingobacterium sp. JB170]
MRAKWKTKASRRRVVRLLSVGIALLVIALCLGLLNQNEQAVEQYYAKGFFPLFSYGMKIIFGWIPFSIGDLVYVGLVWCILFFIGSAFVIVFKHKFVKGAVIRLLQLGVFLLAVYVYFYVSWGQNYYRIPLQKQLSLNDTAIKQDDYLAVVDRYIDSINTMREGIEMGKQCRIQAEIDIEQLMLASTDKLPMLSRSQVKVKHPISSHLISYFTVTGYFNPFTHEVHVNQVMPKTSYPFTVSHELAHQMGIGLEDECNFVAFLTLHDHPNIWYRYAAYYETVHYLLRPLYYQNRERYNDYVNRMSDKVREDYRQDHAFWQSYIGWISSLSDMFYGGYLRHNNQPEGAMRYTLMGRLVVAWENQKM